MLLETVTGYHLEFEGVPVQSVLPKSPLFTPAEIQLIEEEFKLMYSS